MSNELVNVTTGEVFEGEVLANVNIIDNLNNPETKFFCSLEMDSRKDRIKVYNAINNEDFKLGDEINQVIEVVDVVAHEVELTDEDGQRRKCGRVILIDKNGKTHSSVADGILSSLQKIIAIVGSPSWKDEPLKVRVKTVKTRQGYKTNVLELMF